MARQDIGFGSSLLGDLWRTLESPTDWKAFVASWSVLNINLSSEIVGDIIVTDEANRLA